MRDCARKFHDFLRSSLSCIAAAAGEDLSALYFRCTAAGTRVRLAPETSTAADPITVAAVRLSSSVASVLYFTLFWHAAP